MEPRGGGGDSAGVVAADAAPAVRAMSFISNSLSQVQRSAESDMELIRHRFQSLKQLSNSLDKEWGTRLRNSSLSSHHVKGGRGGDSSSGNSIHNDDDNNNNNKSIWNKLSESSTLTGSSASSSSSSQPLKAAISSRDFDFLKNLKPNLSNLRRSWSDPDFLKPRDGGTGWDLSLGKSLMTSKGSETGLVDFFSRKDLGSTRKVAGERRFVVKQGVRRKKASRRQKLSVNEWEPLRRVKESVKDSLRDLESTAATSKTPSEFFENVQKTEFFENVKKNLVGSIPTFAAAEDGVILCWFSTATIDISYRFLHSSGGVT
jgi:digalactosyldiacylglycerol synthase